MDDNGDPPPSGSAFVATLAAITATYVYFLLFAEFSLLGLFAESVCASGPLRLIMGALGIGGLVGSLAAGRLFRLHQFQRSLTGTLIASGLAGCLLLSVQSMEAKLAAVLAVGLSLGALTVTLASGLRAVFGVRRLGTVIGIGTGLAYALCNVPLLFKAPPRVQSTVAIGVVFLAAVAPRFLPQRKEPEPETRAGAPGDVSRWIGIFLVLVWFDSAAFYIIQHTELLRDATWSGDTRLWLNGGTHVTAAAAAGWALDRGGLRIVVLIGLLALVSACVLLETRSFDTSAAAALYTAGVSCYSVAFVYLPASRGRSGETGLLFAIAGWIGSALGIGMAQDLARVPLTFVAITGVVGMTLVLVPTARRRFGPIAAFMLCWCFASAGNAREADAQVLQGREVYIAEGCIHCHSQYHRPGSTDIERWGPARSLEATLAQDPPLIGNRRQGPDLARVGQRRTPEWNRLHLIAPRSVTPRSRMPSYAHLFRPGEQSGEALVAYLSSLGTGDEAAVPAKPADSKR